MGENKTWREVLAEAQQEYVAAKALSDTAAEHRDKVVRLAAQYRLTKKQISEATGISVGHVSSIIYERGKSKVNLDELLDSPAPLIGYEGDV